MTTEPTWPEHIQLDPEEEPALTLTEALFFLGIAIVTWRFL